MVGIFPARFPEDKNFFAPILEPIRSMEWAFGPIKMIPSCSHRAENVGFSERKP
jgi:hypothetical protein